MIKNLIGIYSLLDSKDKNKRELVKNHLINEGIGATVYYDPPIHKTPYYNNFIFFL